MAAADASPDASPALPTSSNASSAIDFSPGLAGAGHTLRRSKTLANRSANDVMTRRRQWQVDGNRIVSF